MLLYSKSLENSRALTFDSSTASVVILAQSKPATQRMHPITQPVRRFIRRFNKVDKLVNTESQRLLMNTVCLLLSGHGFKPNPESVLQIFPKYKKYWFYPSKRFNEHSMFDGINLKEIG
ncbi:hypothetical protein DPMN_128940 [Dreissena polymorpha]|uniref:Uncharacterized protein n=1 Tax=Dreissena polymorpha TaxID=45954 RepID=A0A9D4H836_DREPO|nr:hypothetical protein DPMN_128940 [Dreissena polymorpha]